MGTVKKEEANLAATLKALLGQGKERRSRIQTVSQTGDQQEL